MRDLEVEIADGTAKIYTPTGLTFNQRWLMAKNRVASELFKYIGLKEVQFIEKLTAEPELQPPAEPAGEEAEAETEPKAESEEPSEPEV
jgi:FKBP-type peptidyl-prolyl cis-trans isomerase SlyD